jgi:hypothetical protein
MEAASPTTSPEPETRPARRWRRLGLIWHVTFFFAFVLPVAISASLYAASDHPRSFRDANWSSSGLLPPAASDPEARVIVFAARNGTWRSIFATHTWVVVKPRGGNYTRYEITGFGGPLRVNGSAPDSYWFSNVPEVIADLRGKQAEETGPKIVKAIADYPYAKYGDYRIWPGPNSNTFIATVMRAAPELQGALPPTAIGKDFRADYSLFGLTPSGTGVEVSIFGLLGIKAGWVEGIEFNLFTLVAGLDIRHPAIKLPGLGRIGLDQAPPAQIH